MQQTKHFRAITLAARIVLVLSFFLPFFTVCTPRTTTSSAKVVSASSVKNTRLGKTINAERSSPALRGYKIALITTINPSVLSPDSFHYFSLAAFVTLSFYLSLFLLFFSLFKKNKPYPVRDFVLSLILLVSLCIPFVSCIVERDVLWGFYVAVCAALINLRAHWLYLKNQLYRIDNDETPQV